MYPNDLMQILCVQKSFITPYEETNVFKYMLYNKSPPGENVKYLSSNALQATDANNYYTVDDVLFKAANDVNPEPHRLFPFQINSWAQLSNRLGSDLQTTGVYLNLLKVLAQKLESKRIKLVQNIDQRIREVQEGHKMILSKLLKARFWLETLLSAKGMIIRDGNTEVQSKARIEQLKVRVKELLKKYKEHKVDVKKIGPSSNPKLELQSLMAMFTEQKIGLNQAKWIILKDLNAFKT